MFGELECLLECLLVGQLPGRPLGGVGGAQHVLAQLLGQAHPLMLTLETDI